MGLSSLNFAMKTVDHRGENYRVGARKKAIKTSHLLKCIQITYLVFNYPFYILGNLT